MTSRRSLERTERLEAAVVEMEAEYRSTLVEALRACAAGRQGLFGHQEHIRSGLRLRPPVVNELSARGDEIDRLRKRLDMGPYPLRIEFEAARGRVGPGAPGEPKQALEWLERLTR